MLFFDDFFIFKWAFGQYHQISNNAAGILIETHGIPFSGQFKNEVNKI